MFKSEYVHGIQLRKAKLGIPLLRPASLLPQTATADFFNIVGGKVLMTLLIGRISVALGAVGDLTIHENPTTGTTEALCVAETVSNYALEDLVGITGIPGDGLEPILTGGISGMETQGVVLRIGTLQWQLTASSTGEIEWLVFYIPLDDGAYMSVA